MKRALGRPATAVWIVALGLVPRLLAILLMRHLPFSSDAASYVRMAADLTAGRRFIPFWPPGLPLFLAACRHLLGASIIATRVEMLLFYLALSLFLYQAAVRATAKVWCGNVALIMLALSPGTVSFSVEPVTELPAAALLTAIAACLLALCAQVFPRPRWFVALGCGLALGTLILLRPASLVLAVIVPVFLVWRTRKSVTALVVLFVAMAIVLGWVEHVYQTTGRVVAINTANAKNFYLGNNSLTPIYRTWWLGSHHGQDASLLVSSEGTGDPLALDHAYSHSARAYIHDHPLAFAARTFNRVCVFFAFDTYPATYAIATYHLPQPLGLAMLACEALIYFAATIGTIFYLSRAHPDQHHRLTAAVLACVISLYAAPYFLAFSHPRYHVPVEPLLILGLVGWLAQLKFPQDWFSPLRDTKVKIAVLAFLFVQVEFAILMRHAV